MNGMINTGKIPKVISEINPSAHLPPLPNFLSPYFAARKVVVNQNMCPANITMFQNAIPRAEDVDFRIGVELLSSNAGADKLNFFPSGIL